MTLSRRSLLASLLAVPPLRAAPGDPLTLPSRRNDFHQLLVPARIGNSPPLWCELDTGGGGPLVFIDAVHAASLGIQATFVGRSAGAVEGALAQDWRSRVNFSLAGLTFPEQEIVIKAGPLPGDKDASIGMLVLKAFVVELDHDAAAIRLHAPAGFKYTGPGRSFAFTMQDNNPYTTATLTLRGGQRVEANMVIDTGAVASLAYFSRSFVLQNKLIDRSVATAPDTMGRTACRLERFALGPLGVERPVVHAFGAPGFGGMAEPDGMIPADFLRRFRVFMDYTRNRMILEPNRSYAEPSTFDASGIRVHRLPHTLDTMRIYEVMPGTPAAEAGVRAGDLLAALDDTPMQRLSPGMVQESLSREGREIALLLQRDAEILNIRLKLRRLL